MPERTSTEPEGAHDRAARVPRYEHGRRLGAGGMGEVHAFYDRTTGREVAMKTIREERRDPTAIRRFVREARVQAQLEHPSIVPVYDVVFSEPGAPYFTMRKVAGESLAHVLERRARGEDDGRYTTRKLLGIMARIAMTLEYAHSRGVVNRDLKPANVMLGPFDEVYVIDWGLSAVRVDDREEVEAIDRGPSSGFDVARPLLDASCQPETRAGQLLGTPGYLPPEQVESPEIADRRSDIYALGVILFEILTNERLHRGDTVADVLLSTLTTPAASPSERAPELDVPPELDALCRAATSLDRTKRPASAADFARAIELFLDGDRDLARRRELAAAAAASAADALDASQAPGADEPTLRTFAMREVGRALAFDPENAEARIALVRALTEPTVVVPPEAEAELRAEARAHVRHSARNGAFALLHYALYVPIVLWMGIRRPWLFGAMAVAILALVIGTFWIARDPGERATLPWWHVLIATVANACGVWLFGPLVLLPMIVTIMGVAYIETFDRSAIGYMGPAVGVLLVPLVLQSMGLAPPSYALVDGAIRILPGITELPPGGSIVFLAVTNLVVVMTTLLYVWRQRLHHLASQRRLALHAWTLRQLVPADAQPRAPSPRGERVRAVKSR